jgi:hypothetical protein
MAIAYLRQVEAEHRRGSWFVGHLVAAWCGTKKMSMRQILKGLNAPIDHEPGSVAIKGRASLQALRAYEEEHGVKLLDA